MVKLPRDPAELDLPPAPVVLSAGTLLWRVYRRGGAHPGRWPQFRSYGPLATGRFDHHPEPAADHGRDGPGVLYVSRHGPACVAEAFQSNRTIMRRFGAPQLVAFTLRRDVTLLDLCGLWPTAAGASQAIASGPRSSSRAWARAIRAAYPDLEGLRYRSSMYGGEPVAVLNELARDALP
ncbi:MAG: RES family NAD+ phosphorylase, partial [Actinobacteria bacterium]|nr:RES family NAD+ phosphorylase [Actinomycetota bacterium]